MTNTSTQQSETKAGQILLTLLLPAFFGLFNETALNMAFKELITYFGISASTVQWLTTGFLLTIGILVPVSALLVKWFTTRQLYTASVIFSLTGVLIGAMAPNFGILLLGRIIQGIGTGLLIPLLTNIILIIFPIHKRGVAMGIVGLVMIAAPAVGPTISGLILDTLNWRFIYWISAPFLVISLIFGAVFMKNYIEITRPAIDLISILFSTIGFGFLVYGFSLAGENGWSSTVVIVSLSRLFLYGE